MQLCASPSSLFCTGNAWHERREFVAAEPRDRFARPRPFRQPASDLGEHGVTERVTSAIVDKLEPIEVDEENRKWRLRTGCDICEASIDFIEERLSVVQPRKRVVGCVVAKASFRFFSRGDIG